jgi:hypothetical protein
MTALADALKAGPKVVRRQGCSVAAILAKLSDEDRTALEAAFALDSGFGGEELADLIVAEGHHVRGHTVQRHRAGKCSCGAR